jgi:hypothetical protein
MEDKKMQKIISIITTVLILVCFSTVSAHADRKTMEGFMLGTGVAILGAAIVHGINRDSKPQYAQSHSNYSPPRHNTYKYAEYRPRHKNKHHRKYRHHRSRGHWEIEKTWIEPVYQTKWNPGHYNRRGDWIDGRYEKFIVTQGSWQQDKVWIWH